MSERIKGLQIRRPLSFNPLAQPQQDRPARPRPNPRPDCLFCAIIHDGAPATIVREWADALALVPRSSGRTIGHFLVLPRDHVADFTTDPVVSATVQMRAAELAQELCGQWNYPTSRCEVNTQTVCHLHGHLVARTADDGLALPWNHPTSNRLTELEDESLIWRPRTGTGTGT
ncbi:HIT family protein [Streptomyces sp. NPDC050804]|uniref:HIT family protein n=1 Tax=Streptomyces sp. NPDC050804 TaxID=3154745 RepID=UPI0034198F5A